MPGNLQDRPPPSVIASWPTPNYVDPVHRGWMPIYSGMLQGVATVLFVTRLALRLLNRAGTIGLDDALLIPAFLSATMLTVLIMLSSIRYGLDRHVWDVPLELYEPAALIAWLSQLAFIISTCATKCSVLLFYRRLVKGTYSTSWKWATIVAIVLTVAYCIGFSLGLVFNCNPTNAYWKSMSFSYTKDFKCSNTTVLNPVSGALSVVSDLYSVVLPMCMLQSITIDRQKRIASYAVFSLGLLVVAAGSVRTYYLAKLGHDYDVTWVGFDTLIWADLEAQLAIQLACAPVLRVLFRQLRGNQSQALRTANVGQSSKISSVREVRLASSVAQVGSERRRHDHNAAPALNALKESDDEFDWSSGSQDFTRNHTPAISYEVKCAAQTESYPLQDLQQPRTARRWHGRSRKQDHASSRPSESLVSESKVVPMSWLDDQP